MPQILTNNAGQIIMGEPDPGKLMMAAPNGDCCCEDCVTCGNVCFADCCADAWEVTITATPISTPNPLSPFDPCDPFNPTSALPDPYDLCDNFTNLCANLVFVESTTQVMTCGMPSLAGGETVSCTLPNQSPIGFNIDRAGNCPPPGSPLPTNNWDSYNYTTGYFLNITFETNPCRWSISADWAEDYEFDVYIDGCCANTPDNVMIQYEISENVLIPEGPCPDRFNLDRTFPATLITPITNGPRRICPFYVTGLHVEITVNYI